MADIFEIVGKVSLDGLNKAEKELKGFSGEGEKSASKLSRLGGIAKSVGKGLLVGTGAVVTGAVGLVKQVSSSYGALQQSIGGIETLFGESAQKVIENANNAYTTAGISANDYMQQVTSFSASLLQSLGGDTEKACNSADMAIRDMADNANKMGTSMEMITNAYQGFSKQNYTMLDNLKLGYGGTKGEMERLLADAEKLSGIKYDISNLNDVYSAIHVIQQNLGITGTTAKEAGETIEGSFNSLSASWHNFLAGLGDPNADMKAIVDNLAKGISGAVQNVIPVINNMVAVLPTVMDAIINAINELVPSFIETFTTLITKVIDAIVKLLPTLIPVVIDMLKTVIDAIVTNLPLLIDAVILLINEVLNALSEMLPTLIPAVVQAIVDIANSLLDNLPIILEAVLQVIIGVAEGILNALPILIEALPKLIEGIINFITSSHWQILEASIKLLMAIVEAIPTIITALIKALPQIIVAIIKCFISEKIQMIKAFINIFMAIIDAIPDIVKAITESMPLIIEAIIEVMKELPPMFNEIWSEVIKDLAPFFSKFVSNAKTGASNFVNKIKEFIQKLPYNLGVWLGKTLSKVVTWGKSLVSKGKEAGKNFVSSVKEFIQKLPENIHNILNNVIPKIIAWGNDLVAKGKDSAIRLFNSVVNGIKNLPNRMVTLGKDIVKGLWNGITGAGKWISDKIGGFCNNIINGFKKGFDSHSPAKKLVPIGNWITQGLGVGITEDDSAEKSMLNKVNRILGIANNTDAKINVRNSVDDMVVESPMQKYQLDFNAQIGSLNDGFDRLISLIGQYLPDISANINREIVLDGNSLAVGMSRKIDSQLGKISTAKGRGNV